jgi:hypothetical protein
MAIEIVDVQYPLKMVIFMVYILVGGLEHEFYGFPHIGNFIIPTDELIFFKGVETTNQIIT